MSPSSHTIQNTFPNDTVELNVNMQAEIIYKISVLINYQNTLLSGINVSYPMRRTASKICCHKAIMFYFPSDSTEAICDGSSIGFEYFRWNKMSYKNMIEILVITDDIENSLLVKRTAWMKATKIK